LYPIFCSIFCKTKLVANVHEKVHPFSFFIHIFIYKYHSFVTHVRIFFHVTKYFVLGMTKYSLNILSTWEEYSKKNSFLLPCSCHLLMFMLVGSWNNILHLIPVVLRETWNDENQCYFSLLLLEVWLGLLLTQWT
jgi:hypothetical protein